MRVCTLGKREEVWDLRDRAQKVRGIKLVSYSLLYLGPREVLRGEQMPSNMEEILIKNTFLPSSWKFIIMTTFQ